MAPVTAMPLFHQPLFFTGCKPHTGPLSDLAQAYLRRPSKQRASRFKPDGLRYRASVIR
jgi:hypothetical protein